MPRIGRAKESGGGGTRGCREAAMMRRPLKLAHSRDEDLCEVDRAWD